MSDFDPIPEELKERRQWLMWDSAADTPRRPHWDGDFYISWNDPNDWHTFEEAVQTAQKKDSYGIGFVFSDFDDYLALDLDGCLNDRGGPKDWLPSIERFNGETYMERSASGTGVHIILKNQELPDWWSDSHFSAEEHEGVEAYEEKFFAFTGDAIETSISDVGDVDPVPWLLDAFKEINGMEPKLDTDDGSSSTGDDVNVDVYDVISRTSYPEGERCSHPFHGSGTGSNFNVDDGGETWRCWRHSVTGNGLHLFAVREGIIDCGDWHGTGLDSETWSQIFDAAREDGLDVPAKKNPKPKSGAREAVEASETDGGTAAASPPSGNSYERTIESRVESEVLVPLDPPEDSDTDPIKNEVAINRMARILTDEYAFIRPRDDVRGWRDTLYNYVEEDGIYEPQGETFIEAEAERLLGSWATNQRVNELVRKVERRSRQPRVRELQNDPHRLVVGNGILDLHTGTLTDYTSDEYHRVKIDIDYRPDAECDAVDDFFHEIVDDNDVPTLYQLVAHTLYKEYVTEKAAMLLGDGQNGKSVFLSLVEEFLGRFNVSHRALQDFDDNDFAANDLEGKLANVHPDMGDEMVRDLGTFKKLTGRDMMTADVKYEKPITFENHATLLFAANRMPVMDEDTHALWRRWIYVNFPYTFDATDPDAKDPEPKAKLMRRITDEEEMEGLLARCVQEISEWWDGRSWFTNIMDPNEVREKMKRASEPIYDFAAVCLDVAEEDDEVFVPKDRVRSCYRKYAREEGLPTKSDNAFGEELLNLRDFPIESSRKRINGQRVQVYTGVTLSSRGRQVLGLDVDDENEQLNETGTNRPEIIRDVVRDLEGSDSGPSKAMVIGRASTQMSMKTAKRAFEKARERSLISLVGDDEFRAE